MTINETNDPADSPETPLDEIIDWSDLEEDLEEERFSSGEAFWAEVERQYVAAGVGWQDEMEQRRAVLAGMFPEYRDKYEALPGAQQLATVTLIDPVDGRTKLTAEAVRGIRREYAEGKGRRGLAPDLMRRYGVSRQTIYNIANGKRRSNIENEEVAA